MSSEAGPLVGSTIKAGRIGRMNRSSVYVLAFALLLLAYQLIPPILTYMLPSDGWSLDLIVENEDFSNATVYFKTHLTDGPSLIREGDILLAVEGHPIESIMTRWATFSPTQIPDWKEGQLIQYIIERNGQLLDLDITLQPLTVQSFFRHALETWQSPWLALFMYLVFLPAMVLIGAIVFYHQPRQLAAQALFLLSISFVGQLSYAPNTITDLFNWFTSIPYTFLMHRWTAMIIPTTLLLSLCFPAPKRWLRSHLPRSLALIYLPWWVGGWMVPLLKSGDIAGMYTLWIGMVLVQLSLLLGVVGALIHSFFTVRGVVERMQLKWFTAGLTGFVIAGGISWVIGSVLKIAAFNTLVNYFGYLFLPVCLAFAILRYKLFDIDLIIRRTLLYAGLSVALGLVYFGSVVLFQQVLGRLTGDSTLAIVLSTLLVAALFERARRSVQTFIDRRFYRQKYNAVRTLEEFSSAARREVELSSLTTRLVGVVEKTVQPATVSMWLKKER